jgi:hypothetical protein
LLDDLKVNGEFITLNGHTKERDQLYIEWVDYGDNYYDIQLCDKLNGQILGGAALTALEGTLTTKRLVLMIMNKTGIYDVRNVVNN